jgi:pimeloyl-ACP methyl ester carboxylesterase
MNSSQLEDCAARNPGQLPKHSLVYAASALLALSFAGTLAGARVTNEAPAAAADNSQGHVKTRTACLTAHVPGDPIPISVTGTLYFHRHYTATDPVLLLLHGLASNRGVWDGGVAGDESPRVARLLAERGYVVIAIDRPGYGDSPYPNANVLTGANAILMEHEIVGEIRSGSYTVAQAGDDDDTLPRCPAGDQAAFGSPTVILIGHSSGGGQAQNYTTRFHDISATVAIGSHGATGGNAHTLADILNRVVLPQIKAGSQFPIFLGPGPMGVSTDCLSLLFYQPGAEPEVYNAICSNAAVATGTAPVGEFVGPPVTPSTRDGVIAHQVGATPVLLVFPEQDALVPGPGNPFGDPDFRTKEIDFWNNNCACDVTSLVLPNTGHHAMFHLSAATLVDEIDSWLTSRGLGPKWGGNGADDESGDPDLH